MVDFEGDFGSISFYMNGLLTEGWMFVMRLSASGRGFHRIYLNQAQRDRQESERFVAMRSHYGFRPDFCEAADPESKGVVEALCRYAQTDLVVPAGG